MRAKHNATPAQVILAWAIGEGYAVIPSSTKREILASNLKAQDLQLDAEDRQAIAALDCNDRLVSPEGLAPEWTDRLNQHERLADYAKRAVGNARITAPAGAVLHAR